MRPGLQFRRPCGVVVLLTATLAAPTATAHCSLLYRMAELPWRLERLAAATGTDSAPIALARLDEAVRRIDHASVEQQIPGELASAAPLLIAYRKTVAEARRLAAAGDREGVKTLVESDIVWAGAELVQKLNGDLDCPPIKRTALDDALTPLHESAVPSPRPSPCSGSACQTSSEPFFKYAGATAPDDPTPEAEPDEEAADSSAGEKRERLLRRTGAGAGIVALIAAGIAAPAIMRIVRRVLFGLRKRQRKRIPCRYKTRIARGGEAFDGLVIDVTRTGAQISAGFLRAGDAVTIDIAGDPVAAEVRWRGDFFVGVRFVVELTDNQLKAVLPPEIGRAILSWNSTQSEFE